MLKVTDLYIRIFSKKKQCVLWGYSVNTYISITKIIYITYKQTSQQLMINIVVGTLQTICRFIVDKLKLFLFKISFVLNLEKIVI